MILLIIKSELMELANCLVRRRFLRYNKVPMIMHMSRIRTTIEMSVRGNQSNLPPANCNGKYPTLLLFPRVVGLNGLLVVGGLTCGWAEDEDNDGDGKRDGEMTDGVMHGEEMIRVGVTDPRLIVSDETKTGVTLIEEGTRDDMLDETSTGTGDNDIVGRESP